MDMQQQEQHQPFDNNDNDIIDDGNKKKNKYQILILGASYGSLLGTKILMAGHDVTLICRESTATIFNEQGSVVLMPVKGSSSGELMEIRSQDLPAGRGTLTACTPESILSPQQESSSSSSSSCSSLKSRFDLAVLAMPEPQYSAPGVRELVVRIAQDEIPTMAITNMPLIPYLRRILNKDTSTQISSHEIRSCFTEPDLWTHFTNPHLFTQCSPDPQAFRPHADAQPNVLQVRLPTNFKAARFGNDQHTQILKRLEQDMEAARLLVTHNTNNEKNNAVVATPIPVKLKVHDSLFVPLAKWAMLLAGNYRCVQPFPADMISIQQAVTSNLETSRVVYDWVVQVCLDLGNGNGNGQNGTNVASLDDFVPFAKYAAAATSLTSPSSAARALAAGATSIERVDKLVLLLAAQQGKTNTTVTATVAAVDEWLARNQEKKKAAVVSESK